MSTHTFEPLLDDKQAGELLKLHGKTVQRFARRGEMVFLVAVTGLRVSELLALKCDDVDFHAAEIHCPVRLSVSTSAH